MTAVTVNFIQQTQNFQQFNTYNNRPGYRFKANVRTEDVLVGEGPGRRLRKNVANVRRHVDYVPCVFNHAHTRLWQSSSRQHRVVAQPDELYQNSALPPSSTVDKPVDCVLTKFVRAAMNKVKCPVYSLAWTPEGKRLITGASSGEFTLWNGTAFNFETILQAHDVAVRSMTWAHNGQWLISGDADGFVKYWQPNMNNVHMFHAHKDDAIRGLKFSSTDLKFVTGSDDGTAKIWDFARYSEEFTLRGHGSEVRCVDWHPTSSLICTGSRDTQQPIKMWDAASGKCVITLQHHKASIMAVEFNQNGNWLLTASRDQLIKLYDIRTMKVLKNYRGHKKEVTSLAWHPIHESLFVTGGGDGSLAYWLVDNQKEVALLEHAHDQAIWCLQWHPLGHILATGSNDNNTKFWARNRPGDTHEDIFGLASFTSNLLGSSDYKESKALYKEQKDAAQAFIPGMGLDEDVYQSMNRDVGNTVQQPQALQLPEDLNAKNSGVHIGAKRTLIKQPPPKRAQRQFERMWNVSKPGGTEDDDDHVGESDPFKREKTSLLGAPPPVSKSMLSAPPALKSANLQPPGLPPPNKPSMLGGSSSTAPSSTNGPPHKPPAGPPPFISAPRPPFPPTIPGGGMAWPPGIPMPPNIAALQGKLQEDISKDEDVDYRNVDEDLRSTSHQAFAPTTAQGPPRAPMANQMPPHMAPSAVGRQPQAVQNPPSHSIRPSLTAHDAPPQSRIPLTQGPPPQVKQPLVSQHPHPHNEQPTPTGGLKHEQWRQPIQNQAVLNHQIDVRRLPVPNMNLPPPTGMGHPQGPPPSHPQMHSQEHSSYMQGPSHTRSQTSQIKDPRAAPQGNMDYNQPSQQQTSPSPNESKRIDPRTISNMSQPPPGNDPRARTAQLPPQSESWMPQMNVPPPNAFQSPPSAFQASSQQQQQQNNDQHQGYQQQNQHTADYQGNQRNYHQNGGGRDGYQGGPMRGSGRGRGRGYGSRPY